jgi:hypothetical protein
MESPMTKVKNSSFSKVKLNFFVTAFAIFAVIDYLLSTEGNFSFVLQTLIPTIISLIGKIGGGGGIIYPITIIVIAIFIRRYTKK